MSGLHFTIYGQAILRGKSTSVKATGELRHTRRGEATYNMSMGKGQGFKEGKNLVNEGIRNRGAREEENLTMVG